MLQWEIGGLNAGTPSETPGWVMAWTWNAVLFFWRTKEFEDTVWISPSAVRRVR